MPATADERPVASPAPREASTVVLLRPGPADGHEIFMVRRSALSPFMPSTLVFPGGRVDPQDGAPDGPGDGRFARAARRECLEETGVDLGGVTLHWFDTWITPSAEPRRYEARFFAAFLASGAGGHARADGHETHDGRWATAAAHLRNWAADDCDLPPPTLATLLRLRDLEATDPSLQPAEWVPDDPASPILPKLVDEGAPTIVMPHDPAYADLPGAGAPAPMRVHPHPRRFVRDRRRWMPWPP